MFRESKDISCIQLPLPNRHNVPRGSLQVSEALPSEDMAAIFPRAYGIAICLSAMSINSGVAASYHRNQTLLLQFGGKMYFCIWKSPLIILLFLGYKAISVAGGKVLLDITDHICILSYIQNIAVCALSVFWLLCSCE